MSFLVLHLAEKERADCFALIVFLLSCCCKCSVALPHGAVGRSAVCDCGFSICGSLVILTFSIRLLSIVGKLLNGSLYTYDIQNEEKSQPAVMTGKSHNLRFSATRHKMDMTPGGFFSSASVLKQQKRLYKICSINSSLKKPNG